MDVVTPSREADAPGGAAAPGGRQRRSIVLAAAGVSAASALNIFLGFAFQIALAALYGTSPEMDAYLAASTIPNILTVVLFGSLSITFVPVFIEYQVRGRPQEAWQVMSGFLYLTVAGLMMVTAALWAFAEPIIAITTPGFAPGSSSFLLTVSLFRWLLPTIVLIGVASLLRSFYNAQRRFMQAAWAPVLNSLLILVVTVALAPWLGVTAVAIGSFAGAVAQFALLVPSLFQSDHRFSWRDMRHPGVARVLLLMTPWVLSAIFYKSNTLVDRFLASQLDVGAISALGYANRLMTAITTVLTQGISVVLFPLMAEYVAADDQAGLRGISARGIRLTLLLAVPTTVFLSVLSEPIVRLLFERGQFDLAATAATAPTLVGYNGALLAGAVGSVLTFIFYAKQDTMTVALVGVVGFGVNIAVALWLTPLIGAVGPAIAYSVAALFNLIVLGTILRVRLQGLDMSYIAAGALRIGGAAFCAGCIWAWGLGALELLPHTTLALFLGLSALSLVGGLVYLGLCLLVGVDELSLLHQQIRRRLGRAPARV